MTATTMLAMLGGKRTIRIPPETDLEFVEAVRGGFPVQAAESLVERGRLSFAELEQLVIPRRTLTHRKHGKERLSRDESDKLARVARVLAAADDTFGQEATTDEWLRRPNRALGGTPPITLLDTDGGARLVEQVLGRLAYGVYS